MAEAKCTDLDFASIWRRVSRTVYRVKLVTDFSSARPKSPARKTGVVQCVAVETKAEWKCVPR